MVKTKTDRHIGAGNFGISISSHLKSCLFLSLSFVRSAKVDANRAFSYRIVVEIVQRTEIHFQSSTEIRFRCDCNWWCHATNRDQTWEIWNEDDIKKRNVWNTFNDNDVLLLILNMFDCMTWIHNFRLIYFVNGHVYLIIMYIRCGFLFNASLSKLNESERFV